MAAAVQSTGSVGMASYDLLAAERRCVDMVLEE